MEVADLKTDLDEIKRLQNLLGDYVDVEFKKVLDAQQRVHTLSIISGIATIVLAGVGTVIIAYDRGQQKTGVMTTTGTRCQGG